MIEYDFTYIYSYRVYKPDNINGHALVVDNHGRGVPMFEKLEDAESYCEELKKKWCSEFRILYPNQELITNNKFCV